MGRREARGGDVGAKSVEYQSRLLRQTDEVRES